MLGNCAIPSPVGRNNQRALRRMTSSPLWGDDSITYLHLLSPLPSGERGRGEGGSRIYLTPSSDSDPLKTHPIPLGLNHLRRLLRPVKSVRARV